MQPQRTTLSWTRTGVAAGVLAGVLLRGAATTHSGIAVAAAVAGVLGSFTIVGVGSRAFRPARSVPGRSRSCDYRGVQIVTAVVFAVGLLIAGTVVAG